MRANFFMEQKMNVDKMLDVVETGMKLKKVMQKKNITYAKCKCPHCEHGFIYGRLLGKKNHLHMKCDGCDVTLME